jgi:hypothetical protein
MGNELTGRPDIPITLSEIHFSLPISLTRLKSDKKPFAVECYKALHIQSSSPRCQHVRREHSPGDHLSISFSSAGIYPQLSCSSRGACSALLPSDFEFSPFSLTFVSSWP